MGTTNEGDSNSAEGWWAEEAKLKFGRRR
uniref:Uncharacterized protein n=1 Tax=Arundo donax TaxID=35708 RepID=A0A0A9FTK5_ARUDO